VSWTDEEIQAYEDIYGAPHTSCECCNEGPICLKSLCLSEACDIEAAVIPASEMQFSESIRARCHAGCVEAWERGEDVQPWRKAVG
jgi:hypothetical protein